MAKELQNATNFPAAAGPYAYQAALMVAGASQATAGIVAAPIVDESEITVYHLPGGNTVLTLEIARYDLIVADNPGSTTLEVPSEATLGYTRTAGKDLSFYVQRRGTGPLAVNFTAGGTPLVEDNDLDPSTLGRYHTEVRVGTVGAADQWVYT